MSSDRKSIRYQWRTAACLLAGLLACTTMTAWAGCDGSAGSRAGVQAAEKRAAVPAGKVQPPATKAKPFNMDELIERLKKTDAIGFLTKLTLRSDAIDLMDMVKAYKQHDSRYSLADLHARFNGLLLKVLALLGDDPKLSRDISTSRDDIWKSLMEVKA